MKWALVTGASAGIGFETSLALAKSGYDLILVARRESLLLDLANQIEALGRGARLLAMDITSDKDLERLSQLPELESLHVLVNNAGLALGVETLQEGRPQDWQTMMDVNVMGLLKVTHVALPHLIRHRGHIVNIGSVAGEWTYPGGAVYCATKAAVHAISEGLRLDLIGSGVRVSNIQPGMVNTEFSTVRMGSKEKADKVYEGMTPLSGADIAESVVWCLNRPAHVNVQEIMIFPTDQAGVGYVHRK